MNILIVGAGTVGEAICAGLAKEGHDLTVIDRSASALEEISTRLDLFGVEGNGAEPDVLRRAGAEHADLLIAVTDEDEINLLCCAVSKKLGTKQTVARVRNPGYTSLAEMLAPDLALAFTINPESAAASEIHRMLRFPSAAKVDTFCHGRVDVAEMTLGEDCPFLGMPLNEIRSSLSLRILVAGVRRGEEVSIPNGAFCPEAGDVICVAAEEKELLRFFKAAGAYRRPVQNVLIVGGGRTTYSLLEHLEGSKLSATVIEQDKTLCRELAERFPAVTVIRGNGMRQELLEEEGLGKADAFLALSGEDEENAIASLFAAKGNVPKIVTMIHTMPYVDLFRGMGLESIVTPKSLTTAYILRFVRSIGDKGASEIRSLHKLMDGALEALEFVVTEEIAGLTDLPLRELSLRNGVLICAIARGNDVLIPTGDDAIRRGDHVIVATAVGQMDQIEDIIK